MNPPIPAVPDPPIGQQGRCAVLLVNLGTPDAPTPAAVRRYLAEFLADRRVVDLPRWLWLPALYGLILPLRGRRSAHAYAQVWSERGSPLAVHTADLAEGLASALGDGVEVAWAMRYGQPPIASVLHRLRDRGVERVLVLPLYPQYSATTTASVFDGVAQALRTGPWLPELRFVNDYWREDAWIDAVAASIRRHRVAHPGGERLLFSFHGIPQRYIAAGDPYGAQCRASAERIAARAGLDAADWTLAFQSRVGREPWLMPYTEDVVVDLAREGVRRLDVVCPGFAVDCLETLEEIAMRNGEAFVAAGGERLAYVPALNAGADHVGVMAALVRRHGADWPVFANAKAGAA